MAKRLISVDVLREELTSSQSKIRIILVGHILTLPAEPAHQRHQVLLRESVGARTPLLQGEPGKAREGAARRAEQGRGQGVPGCRGG